MSCSGLPRFINSFSLRSNFNLLESAIKTSNSQSLLCNYGYHYCTTSFNKAWTQVMCRFKSCSRRVGDWRWWGSLTMVPAGNESKRLSSVNHATKIMHQFIHSLWCKRFSVISNLEMATHIAMIIPERIFFSSNLWNNIRC